MECPNTDCNYNVIGTCERERMTRDAADALEAAGKRIAELEKQAELTDQVDAMNFAMHLKQVARIAELEAQLPKEGEWKKILQNGDGTSDYQCSACLGIIMDVPDDDEHPLCSFCPNCGARMDGKEQTR
jgi:homoaconitase/3-isopropylmalate dehydratase large subunit